MDCKKVGLFIKELRKKKGWTQQNLADQISVSDKAVSKWERGIGCPDITLIGDLAEVLEVSISEILAGGYIKSATSEIMDTIATEAAMSYAGQARKSILIKMSIVVVLLTIALAAVSILFYLSKASLPTTEEMVGQFETATNEYFTDAKVFLEIGRVDNYYNLIKSQAKVSETIGQLEDCYNPETKKYKAVHFFKLRFEQFAERVKLDASVGGGSLIVDPAKEKRYRSAYELMEEYYDGEWRSN